MGPSGLPKQIETLVDHLRKNDTEKLSLTEVASVTEVLIRTMDRFFGSVDTGIYQECQNLTDYISNARKEIAALQPENMENVHIPRAGKELDAIVKATEEATNTIMTAAEEIMAADTEQADTYQQTVNDAVMRIFEACSFQDITGQRISKVVETLTYIEKRALELKALLGTDGQDYSEEAEAVSEDKALLRGPALEGEGIDQTEVDALMADDIAVGTPPGQDALEPNADIEHDINIEQDEIDIEIELDADEQETKNVSDIEISTEQPADAPDTVQPKQVNGTRTPTPKKASTDKVEKTDKPDDASEHTTQADIDALFG